MIQWLRDQEIRDEGRSEGREEGRAEGRMEGRDERDREMICKKLLKGWPPERIHSDDEYPMELILEVQETLPAGTAGVRGPGAVWTLKQEEI